MGRINSFDDFVNEAKAEDLAHYYTAAQAAESEGSVSKLSKLDQKDKQFTFYHIDDKCDVTVYFDKDSHTVVMVQDYKQDKAQVAPDDDDISIHGFIDYLTDTHRTEAGARKKNETSPIK